MIHRGPAEDPALVTVLGASGFIGTAVLAALAPLPLRVRAVARRPVAPPPGPARFEVRTADLTDPDQLAGAVTGAHAVISLVLDARGWRGADDAGTRVDVDVMRRLVRVLPTAGQAAPRPPVVLFAGSASQVGPPPRLPIDGSEPDRPATGYDRQKQLAEDVLMDASRAGLVRGVSLRLPTVFGPSAGGPDRGVVSAMIRRALAGQPLTMWHDGRIVRELLYVHDAAAAFVAALEHADTLAGRHWPLGRGRAEPLGAIFRMIAGLVAEQSGRPPVPVVAVPPPADARHSDFHDMAVDPTAFATATGWHPAVPLRDALRRTVAALAHDPAGTGSTL